MAKIAAVRDHVDDLGEEVRGFYTQGQDEKWYLDLEGVDGHPSVLPALRKKDELLGEVKGLKAKLAGFEGIEDAEKARDALRRLPELEAAAQGGGASAERIQQLQKDHQEQIAALKRQVAETVTNSESAVKQAQEESLAYYRDSEITKAITAAQGEPEFLKHIVAGSVKAFRTDEGRFAIRVLDPTGNERIKDAKLTPFSLEDYVSELKENPKFGRAFAPSGANGSGATGGNGGSQGGSAVRVQNGMIVVNPADVLSGKAKVTAPQGN